MSRLRGLVDLLWGGPGLRRGRRPPSEPHVGDHIDFWHVEAFEEPTFVKLQFEMALPGEAWLEWTIEATLNGSKVTQRARFKPGGLWGGIYWYSVLPFHFLVFPGLLRGIVENS